MQGQSATLDSYAVLTAQSKYPSLRPRVSRFPHRWCPVNISNCTAPFAYAGPSIRMSAALQPHARKPRRPPFPSLEDLDQGAEGIPTELTLPPLGRLRFVNEPVSGIPNSTPQSTLVLSIA